MADESAPDRPADELVVVIRSHQLIEWSSTGSRSWECTCGATPGGWNARERADWHAIHVAEKVTEFYAAAQAEGAAHD